MLRKRGNPVFLELMQGNAASARNPSRPPMAPPPPPAPLFEGQGGKATSASPAGEGVGGTRTGNENRSGVATPVAVEAKPASRDGAGFSPWSADQLERRGRELVGSAEWARSPWILLAGLVAVALIVWIAAYSVGLSVGKRDGDKRVADVAARYNPPSEPLSQEKPSATARPEVRPAEPVRKPSAPHTPPNPPTPKSEEPAKPDPGAVSALLPGYNYLVVATLMKADADEAAEYLQKNDVPVALRTVSGKAIDPASPEANNVQWQVVVLKGYAPADLGRLSGERMALATRVQSLGRKWKAENKRAPTDFAQVFWWKFKGKAAGPEGGN